nr:PREDICTED: T-cell-specific surface glycoprotein CD28 homolog [Opisthocomus hoazin]
MILEKTPIQTQEPQSAISLWIMAAVTGVLAFYSMLITAVFINYWVSSAFPGGKLLSSSKVAVFDPVTIQHSLTLAKPLSLLQNYRLERLPPLSHRGIIRQEFNSGKEIFESQIQKSKKKMYHQSDYMNMTPRHPPYQKNKGYPSYAPTRDYTAYRSWQP